MKCSLIFLQVIYIYFRDYNYCVHRRERLKHTTSSSCHHHLKTLTQRHENDEAHIVVVTEEVTGNMTVCESV